MPTKTFAVAMLDALAYALAEDPRVVVIGASSFIYDRGLEPEDERALFEKFPTRLIDPPTSEGVVTSLATGAAMAGMRPFVNYGTASFAFEAWNQIINETGNVHAMSNGQLTAPLVLHMYAGIRGGGAAQHAPARRRCSPTPPGSNWCCRRRPPTPRGCCAARSGATTRPSSSPTPGFSTSRASARRRFRVPFGKAAIAREGPSHRRGDLADGAGGAQGRRGARRDGIEVEVIDPRTIVPLDAAAICASVRKTGRLVCVDEANLTCSIASEISALVAEQAFGALKAPILRVGRRPNAPVSDSPTLEAHRDAGRGEGGGRGAQCVQMERR